jgi:hypothetical protein
MYNDVPPEPVPRPAYPPIVQPELPTELPTEICENAIEATKMAKNVVSFFIFLCYLKIKNTSFNL